MKSQSSTPSLVTTKTRATLAAAVCLIALVGCSDSSAPFLPTESTIDTYAERQAEVAARITPVPATPTAVPTPSPTVTYEPAATPTPNPTEPQQISQAGEELGCTDATDLRSWLSSVSPAVAEASQPLAGQIWLCPTSQAVATELDCYRQETVAILDALEADLGQAAATVVNEVRDSGTTFCASGDAIWLGSDAVADR